MEQRGAAVSLGALGLLLLASEAYAFSSVPRLGLKPSSQRLAISPAVRSARTSSGVSIKMQEVRGICPLCNEPVMSNQPRETDDDGVYFHSACVDAKMLAEGQVRMSERELDQLKAMAAGKVPQKPKSATPAAGGGGGGFFGGLFGGGGGGSSSSSSSDVEIVDLPGAAPVATPVAAAPMAAAPAPPAAAGAWQKATDPASGAPYWYNEATGESSWTPPPGMAPVPPPSSPPPPQGEGASKQIMQRMDEAQGTKVVPQPGMAIPFYWQEGIEYAVNRRNTFAMDEMVGILRGDGDIKFGTVMKISPGREGNVYDILVSKDGSYQPGKTPDNLYKILYDVKTMGIKIELRKKESEAPKGLFGW